MTVFGAYSRYYNLFYRDKDYTGEARYVRELIRTHNPQAATLLDLGCGTGKHAFLLADAGLEVAGVDRSEEMLSIAKARHAASASSAVLEFFAGDIRSIRLGRTFDAVVSLFHVVSYQTGNDDLLAAFATARDHLNQGGVFIFDCWYGPAVLTDRPSTRIKRLEDEEVSVLRLTEPVMHPNRNLVEANHQLLVRDKATGTVEELRETHLMRYLFQPEIEFFLEQSGMKLVSAANWMTEKAPGFDNWEACFVAVKQ